MAKPWSHDLFISSLSLCYMLSCVATSGRNITNDEFALLAFKSSINLDPYGMVNNWSSNNSSSSMCNWVGVTCDVRHGRVKALNLSNMGLEGTISPQLGNLSFLVELDLHGNTLYGELQQQLFRLHRLKFLDLSNNRFFGSIPTEVGDLVKLQYLNLGRNNLTGFIPQSISNLSKLEYFNCALNFIEGSVPRGIGHVRQLKILSVSKNRLSGTLPVTLSNLSSLQRFTSSFNYFSGSVPMEIGNLEQLEYLALGFNNLSGPIPSKIFNISRLIYLYLAANSLSGNLPSDLGKGLPNLQELDLYGNKFVGNLPNGISNASQLTVFDLSENEFSGHIPHVFGALTLLSRLDIHSNNLRTHESPEFNFFTSLTSCIHLKYLDVSNNSLLPKLPKSIGNLSKSLENFWAYSSGINGHVPLEIGNLSSLLGLSLGKNHINGPIPGTIKGLQKLQYLDLQGNTLQGSVVDELCEIASLTILNLRDSKLFGILPSCMGNMTSLRRVNIAFNRFISSIPSSFWDLKDILEIDLSSNALSGNLSSEIGHLRAILALDLSRNEISGNIPSTINILTLQVLSLAHNKLQGSIPASIGEMVGLTFLDLSQNVLSGEIPKSMQSLTYLNYVNFSYNILEGEIPNDGPFKNFTAQSFMHNKALCGDSHLHVPPCAKQVVKRRSKEKWLLIKCILPIIVAIILIVACISLFLKCKRKNATNQVKGDLSISELGVPRWISYYELVQATNDFNESNLLGRGSFGTVYKGMLSSGMIVAIKVINLGLEATSKSFNAECTALRNLRHRNLVKIIGSCSNVDFKSLVIEFMSNGSLDKWLHSHNYCLDFLQRLNIIIDVASALEYLHHGSLVPVVHCDLKPSNVLLDENMVAHVSDFGIAKLLDEGQSKTHTETFATLGYIAPEYGSEGIVSVKGDIYSYGILLMEMFTRKKPTDDMFKEGLSLKDWISESMPSSVMKVVDSSLLQLQEEQIDDTLAHVSAILELATNCCANLPEARIGMADVTTSLIKIRNHLFTPNKEKGIKYE
ncbi:hypothetical protein RJT34_13863 [Clitoria ternatea]|uniref:non-specific serine/threonine protein kinase n=1 Tax=Clitoria ternatea TaxID=43366 RepID=A0AAN9JRG4_CLITE